MKTEDLAWHQLQQRGAAQIRSGFADRVLRAARAGAGEAAPFLRPFAVCAAMATLGLVAVSLYRAQTVSEENARNLAGWQEIAAQADDFDQTL
jgi:hypothetical protein